MINIKGMKVKYSNGTYGSNGINLNIKQGEMVYIIGLTGSGKSTIIKAINAELKPEKGRIVVAGTNLMKIKRRHISKYRRKIGVVFQDFRLLPDKTVGENLAFVKEFLGEAKEDVFKKVDGLLNLVGLSDKIDSLPSQLSGGEQQRVAIARAMMNNPDLLIADEPTGNLDPITSNSIMKILTKINELNNTTMLIVTHDFELLKKFPARTLVIKDGMIEADVSKENVAVFVS